jgi:hypothetical protein
MRNLVQKIINKRDGEGSAGKRRYLPRTSGINIEFGQDPSQIAQASRNRDMHTDWQPPQAPWKGGGKPETPSPLHKAQVVMAQALRATQVIGGAGIPHHKRIPQYDHSTASMIVVVVVRGKPATPRSTSESRACSL